jgi:hypothetical protein
MPQVPVEFAEDKEFLESVTFSFGAIEEFLDFVVERSKLRRVEAKDEWTPLALKQFNRSFVDIIGACIERAAVMRRRIDAEGWDELTNDGLLVPWLLTLEIAIHALGHQESDLSRRESRALKAGRILLPQQLVIDLRDRLDIPLVCPACNPDTHFDARLFRFFDLDLDVTVADLDLEDMTEAEFELYLAEADLDLTEADS